MLGHLYFRTYWALGWFPLALILCHTSAQASEAVPAVVTENPVVLETASENIQSASDIAETVAQPPSKSIFSGLSGPKAVPGDAASSSNESAEARNLASREIQPTDITDILDSQLPPEVQKKKPKDSTSLLQEFIASSNEASSELTTISPPVAPSEVSSSTTPADGNEAELPLGDPELGVIQVGDPRRDPELGVIQLRSPLQDPELGILQLSPITPEPPPRPFLFLSTYVAASSSDNVFLVEDSIRGRFGDEFVRPGVSITAFPAIGPNTNLLVSAETNFLRYREQSNSSYDELRFRAGVRHRFSERAYGQLLFSSQLLFDEGYTDQFFTNNGVELTIGRRDPLTPQLTLDTYYQGQLFFSDPSEFSNVLNSVGAYLGYRFAPQWDTGVSYRLTISDFTRQSRHETYQRITGQLRYSITPSVRVSVFGGLSYGRSSEERITFDDTFFGISFDATIQIF